MEKLSDWHWLRKGVRTMYVCPLLSTFNMWLWRCKGRECHWYTQEGRGAGIYITGKPNGKSKWSAAMLFPKWMVRAECKMRQSWELRWWVLNCAILRVTRQRYCLKMFTTS